MDLDAAIPLGAAWSSPFVRGSSSPADLDSIDLAAQVATDGLTRAVGSIRAGSTASSSGSASRSTGRSTAARPWRPGSAPPGSAVRCSRRPVPPRSPAWRQPRTAPRSGDTVVVVTTDRTSNGPVLVHPTPRRTGGAPVLEHWVLDNFERDPWAAPPCSRPPRTSPPGQASVARLSTRPLSSAICSTRTHSRMTGRSSRPGWSRSAPPMWPSAPRSSTPMTASTRPRRRGWPLLPRPARRRGHLRYPDPPGRRHRRHGRDP